MILENITYEDLQDCGTILRSPFPHPSEGYLYPILFDGNVYKFFNSEEKDLAKILLMLEKLKLRYLSIIKGFIKENGSIKGYVYEYDDSPLLKDVLWALPQKRRFTYILQIILTDKALKKNGLTYFDWHTANILAGGSIRLIDIDSIKPRDILSESDISYYLFELLISIYIKYDITFNKDNSDLYGLFSLYFDMPELLIREEIDFRKLFARMLKRDSSYEELREDVRQRI